MTDDLAQTLRALLQELERLQIPYMLVGSVAALAYGRTRATQDFDVVIEVDAPRLRLLVAAFPSERFYVDEQAALDALRHESLFNVVDMKTGWKIDLIPRKRREFSRIEFARRKALALFGMEVFVSSLEDTIVSKLEWSKLAGGSARQLEDASALIKLAASALDEEYVARWVAALGLEDEWKTARQQ